MLKGSAYRNICKVIVPENEYAAWNGNKNKEFVSKKENVQRNGDI